MRVGDLGNAKIGKKTLLQTVGPFSAEGRKRGRLPAATFFAQIAVPKGPWNGAQNRQKTPKTTYASAPTI